MVGYHARIRTVRCARSAASCPEWRYFATGSEPTPLTDSVVRIWGLLDAFRRHSRTPMRQVARTLGMSALRCSPRAVGKCGVLNDLFTRECDRAVLYAMGWAMVLYRGNAPLRGSWSASEASATRPRYWPPVGRLLRRGERSTEPDLKTGQDPVGCPHSVLL
jgi:hypothetical protein